MYMTLHPGVRVAILVLACLQAVFGQAPPAAHTDFFEKSVRPILANKCQGCHNPKSRTAGLDLTTAAGLRKGADTGPVIITGDVENSRLLEVIGY
ncbi:MAG TPA: c-type cytochrome domain-containing protein, partial [Bryobacteraceae bacterium]|nr:c-type cytochrome domain-containing protein [Bryobacteraceae bacterium]